MSKIQQTQQTHAQTAAKANKPQQAQHKSFNPAQLFESPESMRSEDVLAAQQTVGNQVVQRALDKDDRRKGLTDNQGNLRQDLNEQIQQKRGGGSPLPENIQKEASKKLGRNFKDVRIHTDESADKLSRTISARAFTIGKDIFFKNGVFAPGSGAGRETIMHELTHVVQQGGKSGASGALKLGAPDTAHEKEADRIGKKHAASVGAAPAGAVQREGEEDELMMQGIEEEELQMQEEEDELQMQEDEEELQMQPAEEDELQMQSAEEEEELQMQPDAGNIVQREKLWEQDDQGKWKRNQPTPSPANEPIPKAPAPPLPPRLGQAQKPKPAPLKLKKGYANLDTARAALGVSNWDTRPQNQFKAIEEKRDKVKAEMFKDKSPEEGVNTKKILAKTPQGKQATAREKWMSTLKDPKSSKEDIEKAKERLGTFHKDVGKKDFKAAKNERRSALEEAAKSGDDEAYEKWQSERKKTKGEKAKGFFKSAGKTIGSGLLSAGKWAGGKALGFAKGKLSEGVNHFLGIKDDDKDDDAPKVNITNNIGGSGSSGSGGGGGTSEMIAELYQENKKLKAQVSQLEEAAKAKV
jgi:hypothetical protein